MTQCLFIFAAISRTALMPSLAASFRAPPNSDSKYKESMGEQANIYPQAVRGRTARMRGPGLHFVCILLCLASVDSARAAFARWTQGKVTL